MLPSLGTKQKSWPLNIYLNIWPPRGESSKIPQWYLHPSVYFVCLCNGGSKLCICKHFSSMPCHHWDPKTFPGHMGISSNALWVWDLLPVGWAAKKQGGSRTKSAGVFKWEGTIVLPRARYCIPKSVPNSRIMLVNVWRLEHSVDQPVNWGSFSMHFILNCEQHTWIPSLGTVAYSQLEGSYVPVLFQSLNISVTQGS